MSIKRFVFVCLFLLAFCVAVVTENGMIPESLPAVIAQTVTERKAEADRLLKLGVEQFNKSQYREAIQSLQQALEIYQDIKDKLGEGRAINNLGLPYASLGQYQQAIEYGSPALVVISTAY